MLAMHMSMLNKDMHGLTAMRYVYTECLVRAITAFAMFFALVCLLSRVLYVCISVSFGTLWCLEPSLEGDIQHACMFAYTRVFEL